MTSAQSWNEWLADPDRTGTSPEAVIERAVRDAVDEPPATVRRILHGETNEVYDVTTASAQRVVVRIGHRSPSLFPAERWAIDAARASGAVVPEVLHVGELETAAGAVAVCVERHAGGEPLQHAVSSGGGAEPFAGMVREAGRNLARVHTVRTQGFGWPLASDGRGPEPAWADFLTLPAREPEWYRPAALEAGCDAQRFDRALDVLIAHAEVYNADARLLHGDFGAKHVLVDGERLRALIDFEVCRGGDPAYDVACWDIYFHNSLRTDWLLEGYRDVLPLDDTFDVRVRVCLVLLAIRLLGHSAGGFRGFVPLAIKTLDREVGALS